MDDKLIMDNILTSTKSECDLLMHGTIESATPGVHTAFSQILNDTLCMQNEIYAKMTAKGWYPTQNAEQQKKGVYAEAQKYSVSCDPARLLAVALAEAFGEQGIEPYSRADTYRYD